MKLTLVESLQNWAMACAHGAACLDAEMLDAAACRLAKLEAIVEEIKGSCPSDIVGDEVLRMIAALESE